MMRLGKPTYRPIGQLITFSTFLHVQSCILSDRLEVQNGVDTSHVAFLLSGMMLERLASKVAATSLAVITRENGRKQHEARSKIVEVENFNM